MLKHKLVDFIIQFMEEVDKEISEMKLFVSWEPSRLLGGSGLAACTMCTLLTLVVKRKGKIRGRIIFDAGMHSYSYVWPC